MNPLKTQDLQINVEPEKLGLRIKDYFLQKLELPEILTVTVTELRSLLGTDRVKISKFYPDGSGQVIAKQWIYEL